MAARHNLLAWREGAQLPCTASPAHACCPPPPGTGCLCMHMHRGSAERLVSDTWPLQLSQEDAALCQEPEQSVARPAEPAEGLSLSSDGRAAQPAEPLWWRAGCKICRLAISLVVIYTTTLSIFPGVLAEDVVAPALGDWCVRAGSSARSRVLMEGAPGHTMCGTLDLIKHVQALMAASLLCADACSLGGGLMRQAWTGHDPLHRALVQDLLAGQLGLHPH